MQYTVQIFDYYNNVIKEFTHETKEKSIEHARRLKRLYLRINPEWKGWIGVIDKQLAMLFWCDKNKEEENELPF